jgi:erythromycin esterase-like protein
MNTRTFGLVASMVVVAGCAWAQTEAAPVSAPASVDPQAASDWIKANAVVFTTPEAGNGFEDLKGVGAIVGDARIVSLGEPTHGTREAFQMKHRLLEYLVEEKGFSIFSIEANMPESYRLSEYVIDGKGDPKALVAGMYFWTWNTQEVLDMVEWMRAWNVKNPASEGKPRLRFTGFDMQTPDVAWEIAQKFLIAHAPDLAGENGGTLRDVKAVMMRGSLGSTQGGFTSATGAFPAEKAAGKKLKFSCWIRTEGVTGYAGGWWRCDTPTGVNGFDNMQEKQIKGTTEWARHEFTIDVPKDTQNINFGFILSGDGAAWFDDVEIELDGVKYEDPAEFSLDFENDAVKYLSGGSGEYTIKRVEEKPRGGKKCLEIRKKPESEIVKVDPAEVKARAEKIVAAMEARREEFAGKTSAAEADWAIQNARVVAQGASMYAAENGFNARDEAMAANVRWILGQHPKEKIVLWAHNGHVSRDGYMGMKTMGQHLAETHGKEMVVFGFATGAGTYTAMKMGTGALSRDHELAKGVEGSVESLFAGSGLANAIVDLRGSKAEDAGSAWARTSRPMRSIGAMATPMQFFPCVPAESYDVLVWQSATTASRKIK